MKRLSLTVAVTCFALGSACSDGKQQPSGDEYFANQTSVAFDLGCSSSDAKDALNAVEPLFDEFADQFDLASSTSRIALSAVIGDMQSTRREIRDLDVPECAEPLVENLTLAVDGAIDGFLAFQSDEPAEQKFQLAAIYLEDARKQFANLRIDAE